jgi:hypothetical protein
MKTINKNYRGINRERAGYKKEGSSFIHGNTFRYAPSLGRKIESSFVLYICKYITVISQEQILLMLRVNTIRPVGSRENKPTPCLWVRK